MNFSNKRVLVLVGALVTCTVAVMGVTLYRSFRPKHQLRGGDNLVIAYYASKRIAPRSAIEANMIQKRLIPQSQYFSGQATSDVSVLGKVSKTTMLPGEPILLEKLDVPQAFSGLSFSIPEGKRAVSIRVNELSDFAGLIQPGDRVDVVLTYQTGGVKKSLVIVQNEEILAIDQNVKNASEILDLIKPKKSEMVKASSHVVTFALPIEKAQRLILANQQGELTLVLRSFKDWAMAETEAPSADLGGALAKAGSVLANSIPPQTRAVAVRFEEPSRTLAQFLEPGDFVDVLYTENDKGGVRKTHLLLQNKQIYAVNKHAWLQKTPPNMTAGAEALDGGQPAANAEEGVILTFALSTFEAQKISLAQLQGRLTLTLRASGDSDPNRQVATAEEDLMSGPAQGGVGAAVTFIRKGKEQ